MILCKSAGENEFGSWLSFETLTRTYLDTTPLIVSMLDDYELEWLNKFNAKVADDICPLLTKAESDWLIFKTRPLAR